MGTSIAAAQLSGSMCQAMAVGLGIADSPACHWVLEFLDNPTFLGEDRVSTRDVSASVREAEQPQPLGGPTQEMGPDLARGVHEPIAAIASMQWGPEKWTEPKVSKATRDTPDRRSDSMLLSLSLSQSQSYSSRKADEEEHPPESTRQQDQ